MLDLSYGTASGHDVLMPPKYDPLQRRLEEAPADEPVSLTFEPPLNPPDGNGSIFSRCRHAWPIRRVRRRRYESGEVIETTPPCGGMESLTYCRWRGRGAP
jgi:hypothetical protein